MCTSTATSVASGDRNDDDTSTQRLSGAKRSASLAGSGSDTDEELQRLRFKNRTNSKRFRDRKKSYMDGLFEQKYMLRKANNALRDDNERLRLLLEAATLENQAHKRNAALGVYNVQTSRIPPPPANPPSEAGIPHSHIVPTATRNITPQGNGNQFHHKNPGIQTELVNLRQGQPGSTPSVWLVITRPVPDSLDAYKREHGLPEMAVRDMGASLASNVMTKQSAVLVGPPSLQTKRRR